MNASKLHGYTTANTCKATQEYQIQLYLYRCTVGALPQDVLVTPERRMDDGTGFNDLVIRGSSFFWIWELVVNEDDEVDISSRFETRGKGFEGYTGSFQYVLVDFRQNKRGRYEKDGCLYVSFDESYEKALISGLGGAVMTVDLYK
ncbi:hypothetical protein DVH05_002563 [Phytophthora capsici]|nr:hypothetical protein DVH05_002563 [Phytophthora capsici]